MKPGYECILLAKHESLVKVDREWHTRKCGAYVVVDRHRKFILISQRLLLVASFLNSMASDAAERVSVPALHQNVGKTTTRNCGFAKNRWRLTWCELDDVSENFDTARHGFDQAVILGAPAAYSIAPGRLEAVS